MARRDAYRDSSGFTLLEVLIAVAVLAALVAIALPAFTKNDRQYLNAAALILASDIEFAQIMTIANPHDPLVVRFDPTDRRYWVARADSPNTPISHPDTAEPYNVTFDGISQASAVALTLSVHDMPADTLVFDLHGGLKNVTQPPQVALAVGAGLYPRIIVSVSPITGTLSVAYLAKP